MVFTIISTMAGFMMGTMLQPLISPVSTIIEQAGYSMMPMRAPDISTLIEMRRKEIISEETYGKYAKQLGFKLSMSEMMYHSTEKLLNPADLVVLYRRGFIDKETMNDLASKNGYHESTMVKVKKAMEYYPNPQDFIQFAVRDTFNETIVQKYGYDEDYPEQINEQVSKAGMPPEWMKHFWRAHWQLPGITQAYEMLHRGEIDKPTMDELLRIGDMPKYWRDKLINISYSPFTRVDIRRLYKLGVLDADQVGQAYKDIGYDNKKANILRDFTIKYALEEPKTIAENKVKEAFMTDKIDDVDAKDMLRDLGYDDNSTDFIFALWNDDKYDIEISSEIENIKVAFLYGSLTENELTDKVSALGLPANNIQKVIMNIINAKKRLMQLPTKADINSWYNAKIISEEEYKTQLKNLGYGDQYVEKYIEESKIGGTSEFRIPTKADFLAFWKAEIITTEEWIDGMFALGYTVNDIENYAMLYKIIEPKKIQETKIKKAYIRGNITGSDAKKMLKELGYDDEGITFTFNLWIEDKRIADMKAEN